MMVQTCRSVERYELKLNRDVHFGLSVANEVWYVLSIELPILIIVLIGKLHPRHEKNLDKMRTNFGHAR
jgi:hypothetical protein